MESKKAYSRKANPLADSRAQLYLSLRLLLYFTIYTIAVLFAILAPSALKFSIQSFPLQQQFEASREFLFLDRRVVPVILVFALIIALRFLFVTHRIFGPLKRLRKVFSAWGGREWPLPFMPRRKDFHHNLFASFNLAVRNLETDFRRARGLVSACLDTIRSESSKGGRLKEDAALATAEEDCRKALDIFEEYFELPEEKPK